MLEIGKNRQSWTLLTSQFLDRKTRADLCIFSEGEGNTIVSSMVLFKLNFLACKYFVQYSI